MALAKMCKVSRWLTLLVDSANGGVTGDGDEGFSGFGGDYADVLKSAHNTGACDTPTRFPRMPSTGQMFVIKVSSLAHGNERCMSLGGEATCR